MYDAFFNAIEGANRVLRPNSIDYPSIMKGVEGVVFLNRVMESSQRGSLWIELPSFQSYESIPNPSMSTPSVNNFGNPLSMNFPMINSLQQMNLNIMTSVDEPTIPPDQTGV